MNTLTLHIHGRYIGRHAFKAGFSCTPAADRALTEKMKVVSPSAQKLLTEGWLVGWRSAELDTSGW